MKILHLSIVIIACITITIISPHAFADTKESVPSIKGAQFQLKVNQTTSLESDSIKVKFLNVTADSRCPYDVTCIWQGEVKIFVNIIKNNKALDDFSLTSRDGDKDLAIQVFDGYSIQVVKIEPYPTSGKKISFSDYVATFVISKSDVLSPLKQFKSGIDSKNIKCKDNFHLIIKSKDSSPACVKPENVAKLVARGWAMME
jgi:hypothetical protein